MPPTPLRKRLTNEDKMKIIEESKQPGFCRKKTMDKYGISRSAISVGNFFWHSTHGKNTLKEQNGRKFKANQNYRRLFCKPTYP